jgi:GTP cyclohydrolase II
MNVMPFVSIRKVADADFPTRWGHFRILGFEGLTDPRDLNSDPNSRAVENAVALTMGDLHSTQKLAPLVRIHSQCLTGDVFHSLRCDCHDQLHLALGLIAAEGAGILLYEQQEGRGIGLMAKLRAYELQDQGLDTIEANLEHSASAPTTASSNSPPPSSNLGVTRVRLITNNPEKVAALEAAGITVVERISAAIPSEPTFERYLETKRDKMGHLVS